MIRSFYNLALCSLLGASSLASLNAASVTTDPVGYVTVPISSGADNMLSVPFVRNPVFQGVVNSIDENKVYFDLGTDTWNEGQFVYNHANNPVGADTFYLKVKSGEQTGLIAKITSSGSNFVELDLTDEDLNDVLTNVGSGTGDEVELIPFWTFSTLFDSTALVNLSQIYVFDKNLVRVNKSAAEIYTFYEGFGWFDSKGQAADDGIIYPYEGFMLRLPSGASLEKVVFSGKVPLVPSRVVAFSDTTGPNDISISVVEADGLTLGEANLGLSDRVQVYTFDNESSGFNKSASQIFTFYEGFGWFDSNGQDASDVELKPGTSFIFRKPKKASDDIVVWKHTPNYIN